MLLENMRARRPELNEAINRIDLSEYAALVHAKTLTEIKNFKRHYQKLHFSNDFKGACLKFVPKEARKPPRFWFFLSLVRNTIAW
jgi:hypothetical protein